MVALTIPTVPAFPAGYVVQQSDMQALSYAASFLLNKPFTSIHDYTGGQSIATGGGSQITFTTAEIDVDGMWNAGSNNILTIQTPGWYKVRYSACISTPTAGADYNSQVKFTTGSNNPLGSGIVFGGFYPSYATNASFMACGGSGILPYYLYSGDVVHLRIASGGDTHGTTANTTLSGSTNAGSSMSLEFVSTI